MSLIPPNYIEARSLLLSVGDTVLDQDGNPFVVLNLRWEDFRTKVYDVL